MNLELMDILIIFLSVATVSMFFWIIKTERRLKRFFAGKKAKDLEDKIIELEHAIRKLAETKEKILEAQKVMNGKLKKSIRGLELIRFNPFPDQGSNQSFALGMLNEEGDGAVISSLYSRERMSVFAKPIKAGASEHELTEEEREVLDRAKIM